jgi:hypothetical protein
MEKKLDRGSEELAEVQSTTFKVPLLTTKVRIVGR